MDYVTLLGIIAGILTTVAFVPQLIQVIKTKQTRDISLVMFIIFSLGVICWLIYGILSRSLPVTIANTVVLVIALTILGYKIKYK